MYTDCMDFEQIRLIAAKNRVQRLEIFGSASRGEPANDFDFLVHFEPMPALEHGRAYFSLLEELRLALNKPIDLLEEKAIENQFFLQSIALDKKLVYAA